MSRILVVCTANICRSPVAEALLSSALEASGITVASAGTHAVDGAPTEPRSRDAVIAHLGADPGHRSRRLTRTMTDEADLLLTMTVDQRRWVSTEDPRTVRRSFTLRELAALLPVLEDAARFADLRGLAQAGARLRARGPRGPTELDIEDPYGRTPEDHRRAVAQIARACEDIAAGIVRHLGAGGGELP